MHAVNRAVLEKARNKSCRWLLQKEENRCRAPAARSLIFELFHQLAKLAVSWIKTLRRLRQHQRILGSLLFPQPVRVPEDHLRTVGTDCERLTKRKFRFFPHPLLLTRRLAVIPAPEINTGNGTAQLRVGLAHIR